MKPALALLLLVTACRGADDSPPPAALAALASLASPAALPAGPRPAPGIDLPDRVPPPAPHAPGVHRAAATAAVALVADRAVLPAEVPAPPRGGTLPFQLPDDREAWVTAIPEAVQLPAAAYGDGRVYISGGFESVTFYALDAETGRIVWATSHLEDNGPTAAVYDHGRVLFNTESCTLFALDAATGKRQWHKFLGDPTLAQIAVADGLVYSAHPAPDGQQLSAYRVATGEEVWSRGVHTELLAAPVIAGDAVYVATTGGVTYRFARATGALVWAKGLDATTAPWVAGDELFVTRRHGAQEEQIVVDAATGEVRRVHHAASVRDDVPANLSDWKAVWAFEGSRPVVARGVRYDATGDAIRATDAQTGALLWARTDPSAAGARSLSSVGVVGSAIVVVTRAGEVFGLDIDTGYTLWSYALGHRVIAEPIIALGWVYVTTADGLVIGLHVADATLDGWHMFGGNAQHDGAVVTGETGAT